MHINRTVMPFLVAFCHWPWERRRELRQTPTPKIVLQWPSSNHCHNWLCSRSPENGVCAQMVVTLLQTTPIISVCAQMVVTLLQTTPLISVCAQMAVTLLQTTPIISGVPFMTAHPAPTKPKLFESRWNNFFLTRGGCTSCLCVCLDAALLPQS